MAMSPRDQDWPGVCMYRPLGIRHDNLPEPFLSPAEACSSAQTFAESIAKSQGCPSLWRDILTAAPGDRPCLQVI